MPDPVVAPPEPPVAPPEPPVVPVAMADVDGNLRDGWLDSVDEKYRSEPYLKEVKNIQSMASSVVSARRMVGKDKIAIPNETTTDEEMEAWHTAGGRPSTAVDYNIARPDDFPEEHWSGELALAAQDLFHKIGLNSKQAAALTEFNNANILTALKTKNDATIANRQEIKDGLYKDWGAAYPQKEHQGNYAIEKGTEGDPEFKARLTAKFGDDPDFIRFTSNIGGKFAEHGDIVDSHAQLPADLQAEIDKEMNTDAYKNGRHSGHKAIVQKVFKLREALTKVTKTG